MGSTMETHHKILLTGGSGNLGQAILRSGLFGGLVHPSEEEMNITDPGAVHNFLQANNPDAVIHCAAIVNMGEAEENPSRVAGVNIG